MSSQNQRARPSRGPLKTFLVHALGRYAQFTTALILTYHRISVSKAFDPFDLRVSPERFTAQLAYLKAHYRVAPLAELVRQVRGNRFADPGQVAITFDDGYADNFHFALPALQRAGLPATFFVATAYLDSPRGFWWDELETIVAEGGATDFQTPYHELHRSFRLLPDAECQAELDRLRQRLGVEAKPSADDRPLRWAEVNALVAAEHEVGSHTVTHPVLSALSPADVEKELVRSKRTIEDRTGRPVTALAYPYGRVEAVGEVAVRTARDVGYRCGLTTVSGAVRPVSDPFRLRRLHVKDWDPDTFAYELARCFAGQVWPLRRGRG